LVEVAHLSVLEVAFLEEVVKMEAVVN